MTYGPAVLAASTAVQLGCLPHLPMLRHNKSTIDSHYHVAKELVSRHLEVDDDRSAGPVETVDKPAERKVVLMSSCCT